MDISTSCGPASVRIANEYGIKIAGLSYHQSQFDDKNSFPKLVYIADIDEESKKITVTVKDKRDIFVDTIYLTQEQFIKKYNQGTGYTSKQQSQLTMPEKLQEIQTLHEQPEDIPKWIKEKIISGVKQYDKEPFFYSVNYLIDNEYIEFKNWQKSDSLQTLTMMPEWFVDLTSSYAHEQITDKEYLRILEYMVNNRMIRIGR
ncbi:MAG: hypothetical protein HRO68_06315 [Nitrosopumilus sp.]|nr:hypothetical protein [Nitrosopumilus sp.]